MRITCVLALLFAPLCAFAQADITVATVGKLTTQTFRVRQAADLTVSGLPGFLSVQAGGDPLLDSFHLPVRYITSVSVKRAGVTIAFAPQPVGEAPGMLAQVISVPLDVEPQAKVLEIVRAALERAGPGGK